MRVLELSKNLIKFKGNIWVVYVTDWISLKGSFQSQANLCTIIVLIIYYADNCRFVCGRLSFLFMFKCVRHVFWINQTVVICLVNDCITSREQILPVTGCNNPLVIMTRQTYFHGRLNIISIGSMPLKFHGLCLSDWQLNGHDDENVTDV